MEEQNRKQAIQRYLQGEKPKPIYESLNRSKNWFFKWLKRYKTGSPDWYKEHSRAPIAGSEKIPEQQRQSIIQTRQNLEAQRFAQVGVSAIKWELSKQKLEFPSDSTINRGLKREGLVKKNCLYPQRGRVSVF
ncbi:helix-turn-helix domain-containing protein [Thermodesulfobacteriota bacterium]